MYQYNYYAFLYFKNSNFKNLYDNQNSVYIHDKGEKIVLVRSISSGDDNVGTILFSKQFTEIPEVQATCFIHDNQEYNQITITNVTKLGFDFEIEDYSQNYEFNSTIAWGATGMGHETPNSNLAWNFIVSGEGTHNVDNLSQYKEILLCCCVDDDRVLATTIIPYQILDSTLGAEVSNGNHQAAYQVESRVAGVDFISNTSVTLYIKGSDVIPKLYGR